MRAIRSPRRICPGVLPSEVGDGEEEGVRSTEEMSQTPARDSMTARNLVQVKRSIRRSALRTRVKILLVEERIVALATEVHFKQ